MAKQESLEQAHEQGYLELSKWADIMLKRIRMNFDIQHIWPRGSGGGGPYRDYWIINMAQKKENRSTGEAFAERNLYAKVVNGAGGNTVAVDFFFRRYLLFVDWGVGAGQPIEKVPEGGMPKMKKRYARWDKPGDRQRRPVVLGAIRSGRFFLGRILQDYWQREGEIAVLQGLGYRDANNDYIEFAGDLDNL